MRNKDLKDLLTSIDQARKIHHGKLKPGRIFKFNPVVVKNIRKKLHVSQAEFAYMIGVNINTLQNWEQGRRRPEGPALALLKIAEANPKTVMNALHA
ncbi:MAG: type II toxin-antitoxin system MqsA family antitoxin [Candidatus Omnitrophica bacterium]|nr:type II toxin-antitoxin system MqsA family antitoxin [Candidatus Omnitrophota bacterium]